MITWGINALNHGSSIAVFENDRFVSNTFDKSDKLSESTLEKSLQVGNPDLIYWYERPWFKKTRQLTAGQWDRVFNLNDIPSRYLNQLPISNFQLKYTPHHASHAAAGYYTSPFDHCAIVVLDAIGEFECASIWQGRDGKLTKVWGRDYPHSMGLFYSAFTKLIGYSPIVEEHLLQKDSELGDFNRYYEKVRSYFGGPVIATYNFHRGVRNWSEEISCDQDRYDIAAAVQRVFEDQILAVMTTARNIVGTDNLVYMGGCAMNSLANKKVVEPFFNYIWSLPQPGDPSSSIGAVLYHTKKRLTNIDLGVVKHIKINV